MRRSPLPFLFALLSIVSCHYGDPGTHAGKPRLKSRNVIGVGSFEDATSSDFSSREGRQVIVSEEESSGWVVMSGIELAGNYPELVAIAKGVIRNGAKILMLVKDQAMLEEAIKPWFSAYEYSRIEPIWVDSDGGPWTRDFAGHVARRSDAEGLILVESNYGASRPIADGVPKLIAEKLGIPRLSLPLVNEGGNLEALDTRIVAAYTKPLDDAQRALIERYLTGGYGKARAELIRAIPYERTGHSDMFVKFLNGKVLVGKIWDEAIPLSSGYSLPRYQIVAMKDALNGIAQRFLDLGYTVVRIPMPLPGPNDTVRTYVNSLVLNGVVMAPDYMTISGDSFYDDNALLGRYKDAVVTAYAAAGYPQVQFYRSDDLIAVGGAVHCVTMQITGMPYVAPAGAGACCKRNDRYTWYENVPNGECQDGDEQKVEKTESECLESNIYRLSIRIDPGMSPRGGVVDIRVLDGDTEVSRQTCTDTCELSLPRGRTISLEATAGASHRFVSFRRKDWTTRELTRTTGTTTTFAMTANMTVLASFIPLTSEQVKYTVAMNGWGMEGWETRLTSPTAGCSIDCRYKYEREEEGAPLSWRLQSGSDCDCTMSPRADIDVRASLTPQTLVFSPQTMWTCSSTQVGDYPEEEQYGAAAHLYPGNVSEMTCTWKPRGLTDPVTTAPAPPADGCCRNPTTGSTYWAPMHYCPPDYGQTAYSQQVCQEENAGCCYPEGIGTVEGLRQGTPKKAGDCPQQGTQVFVAYNDGRLLVQNASECGDGGGAQPTPVETVPLPTQEPTTPAPTPMETVPTTTQEPTPMETVPAPTPDGTETPLPTLTPAG